MAKSTKRKKIAEDKLTRKANMLKASGQSNYAKKAAYLKKSGGFGADYLNPKPWKSQ